MKVITFDEMNKATRKIYLCCPYSHPVDAIKQARFHLANHAAGKLMNMGHYIFSPISHSHPIDLSLDNSVDHEFWLRQDYVFVLWSEVIAILQLPGWQESTGIGVELQWAEELSKGVVYLPKDFVDTNF